MPLKTGKQVGTCKLRLPASRIWSMQRIAGQFSSLAARIAALRLCWFNRRPCRFAGMKGAQYIRTQRFWLRCGWGPSQSPTNRMFRNARVKGLGDGTARSLFGCSLSPYSELRCLPRRVETTAAAKRWEGKYWTARNRLSDNFSVWSACQPKQHT